MVTFYPVLEKECVKNEKKTPKKKGCVRSVLYDLYFSRVPKEPNHLFV